MNKIYRLVKNRRNGRVVVASELAKNSLGQATAIVLCKTCAQGRLPRTLAGMALGAAMGSAWLVPGLSYATAYTTTVTNANLNAGDTITTTGNALPGWALIATGTYDAPGGNVISTDGKNSYGISAYSALGAAGIIVTAEGANVTTTGDSTAGIRSYSQNGSNTQITFTNGTIATSGGRSAAAQVVSAPGLTGGNLTVSGSTLTTTGNGASGVNAENARATVSDVNITTRGDAISAMYPNLYTDAGGINVSVNGTVDVSGINTVTTWGSLAPGLQAVIAGTLDVQAGTDVATHGEGAYGINADRNSQVTMAAGNVHTYGNGATAVRSVSGATVTLTGTQVETSGDNAAGLTAATVTAAGITTGGTINGAGVTVTTSGNNGSDGIVYSEDGNVALDAASSIATSGTGSHAISYQAGAIATFAAGSIIPASISVSGADSAIFQVQDVGSKLTLQDRSLPTATLGADSWGVLAENGGEIDFSGTVSTQGYGLWARGTPTGGIGVIRFIGNVNAIGSRVRVDDNGLLDISAQNNGVLTRLGSLEGNGGIVQLGTGADRDLQVDGIRSGTYAGAIQGQGNLIRSGTGSLYLTGQSAFDFTGDVQIASGTLGIGGDAHAEDKAFHFTGAQGTLDLSMAATSARVGSITSDTPGEGTIYLGAKDLEVGSDNSDSDFSGVINGTDGTLSKDGSGTLRLTGPNVFGYTGGTFVNDGLLRVGGAANASGKAFDVATAGTLDLTGVTTSSFTAGALSGSGQVHLGNKNLVIDGNQKTTFNGTLDGAGSLTRAGTGTLILQGDNAFSYGGTTTITGGVLGIQGVADPASFTRDIILDGGWLDLSEVDMAAPDETTAEQWPLLHITEGANVDHGGIIGSNDKLVYDVAAGNSQTLSYSLGDGTTLGRQGLFVVKTGDGTLVLSGHNHYVGNTRVLGGWLQVSADDNLGDTGIAREVVLNGGNLDVAGSFVSQRDIDLEQDGTVRVDGSADTTWNAADDGGAGLVLTKQGDGRLAFAGASRLGGVIVEGGVLDMGAATVNAGSATVPAVAVHQGTVGFSGGSITSAGDAIVADGDSTTNLSATSITPGAQSALYRVANGAHGILNASSQRLSGLLATDGAGSRLDLNLDHGSTYTGTPAKLNGGGAVTIQLTDAASTWNVDGDAEVDGLSNAGTVALMPSAPGRYKTLTVNGDYAGHGGTVAMNTELNAGGALSNQHTDRLLINGNVTGTTLLQLNVSGSGANTNVELNNKLIPNEGISLVQVAGQSTREAFKLAGSGYVRGGTPFQYRLFAIDPENVDQTQSVLGPGKVLNWDYRLDTAYLDGDTPVPGVEPPGAGGGGGDGGGRRALAPQGSSYLVAGLALQNYGASVISNLENRLGDIRRGSFDGQDSGFEMYARAIGEAGSYRSDRSQQNYGYDFHQNMRALQIGGDWLGLSGDDQTLRLGLAATIGSTTFNPKAAPIESSQSKVDTRNVALTGTWQHRNGWYVDGVVSAGNYGGSITTPVQAQGNIGARALDVSVETGKAFTLSNGVIVEPQAQVLSQSLRFESRTTPDGLSYGQAPSHAWAGRVGVRVAFPVASTVSWQPYVRLNVLHTWEDRSSARLAGLDFGTASPGSAAQLGIGADGMITPTLSIYGELTGQRRIGGYGFGGAEATLGLRYSFR